MNTQILQHKTAGDKFAVGLDSNGVVVDVWGPLSTDEMAVALGGDWESGMDPESLEEAITGMSDTADQYRLVDEVITLTADALPMFASKDLAGVDEYVEIEASDSEATSYTVRRAWMGRIAYQATDLTAAEVVETCADWGLDGWTPRLHGE